MSDTLTDFAAELRFNPVDAAALIRQVDADGTHNGDQGITIVSDESVEPTFVNVVVTSGSSEGFSQERLGLQKSMDFDPFTGAIITLSHNQAGNLEATKAWARTEDGTNLLDTEEGKASWDELVGLPKEELFQLAASHAQQVMIQAALAKLTEGLDFGDDYADDDPDTMLDGDGFLEA